MNNNRLFFPPQLTGEVRKIEHYSKKKKIYKCSQKFSGHLKKATWVRIVLLYAQKWDLENIQQYYRLLTAVKYFLVSD